MPKPKMTPEMQSPQLPQDLQEKYSGRTFPGAYPELVDDLIERLVNAEANAKMYANAIQEVMQERQTLRETVATLTAEVGQLKDRDEDYKGSLWCALGQPLNIEYIAAVKQMRAERDTLKAQLDAVSKRATEI